MIANMAKKTLAQRKPQPKSDKGQTVPPARRQTFTHYVKAGTEREANTKVQDYYQGDQVVMLVAQLTANGFGILESRFDVADILDASDESLTS